MFIGYQEGEQLVRTRSRHESKSIYGHYNHNQEDIDDYSKNKTPRLLQLIKSGSFIFCSLTRANLFFIFQIIHMFIKQYAMNGLEITNQTKILYFYSITCILGPGLGSFVGGLLSTKLGGYESRRSIIIPLIFGIINCGLIIPLTICSEIYSFSLTLFAYFFSTAAILPAISGFLITSIPKELKGFGTSLELLISTLLGKLPGPIIYGIINDRYQSTNPKIAWRICMYYYYCGFIVLVLACICKRKSIILQDNDNSLIKKPFKGIKGEDYISELTLGDKKDLIRAQKAIPVIKKSKLDTEVQLNEIKC